MLFEEMLKDEKAEGKPEGKAEDIIDLLSDWGTVSEELREKILEERNFDTLRAYLRKAAKAQSVEEFEAQINEKETKLI